MKTRLVSLVFSAFISLFGFVTVMPASDVSGNHVFFVGAVGAKTTAAAIHELGGREHTRKAELSRTLGLEAR